MAFSVHGSVLEEGPVGPVVDEAEEVEEEEEDDGDSGEVNGAVFVRAPVLLACPHSTVASVATAAASDAFGREKKRLRRMWVRDFGGPAATATGGCCCCCCSCEEASLREPVDSGSDSSDCNGFDSFL